MLRLLLLSIFLSASSLLSATDKPAVIVLTDIGGDPDDEQSMVRFLLYSDMFDIKALCATSRLGHGQDTKPEIIRTQIEAYRKVYPNLLFHSEAYPSPDELAAVVKSGRGDQFSHGKGCNSEASDYIVAVADKADGLVHIVVWGGQRELAQALWKVQNTRTKEQTDAFCRKIQVHAIGDQDKYRDWIVENFKDIRYVADAFIFPGKFGIREVAAFRGMYMTGDISRQNKDWVTQNVHGHGALSECYPLSGHGADGMKEGDSPSFLGLIANGLNYPDKPDWGGWGGRFRRLSGSLFIDASDIMAGQLNERHTVSRWRSAFQNDFAARLNWCVLPFTEANHNPTITVNKIAGDSPVFAEARVGDTLTFDASKTADPDKNELQFDWFFYEELSFPGCVVLNLSPGKNVCSFTVPGRMQGRTHHLILAVSDDGTPSLTSYKRIVIRVL